MRTNNLTSEHYRLLESRFVEREDKQRILAHPPFTNHTRKFLTYRHAVRMRRRAALVHYTAREHGQQLLYSIAYDQGKYARDPKLRQELLQKSALSQTGYLPGFLPLYVGMDAILTRNISKRHRLVKGTLLTIRQIVLDEREPPDLTNDPEQDPYQLRFVPKALRVEAKSPDLTQTYGEFWLKPVHASFKLPLDNDTKDETKSTKRWQFPIEPSCTSTAHGIQGQTLHAVEIDFARPGDLLMPKWNKVYANSYPDVLKKRDEYWLACYVMLSRATELSGVAIWRLWDRQMIEMGPPQYLITELQRLCLLARSTAAGIPKIAQAFGSDLLTEIADRLQLPSLPTANFSRGSQARGTLHPPECSYDLSDDEIFEPGPVVDASVVKANCPRCRYDLSAKRPPGPAPRHSDACRRLTAQAQDGFQSVQDILADEYNEHVRRNEERLNFLRHGRVRPIPSKRRSVNLPSADSDSEWSSDESEDARQHKRPRTSFDWLDSSSSSTEEEVDAFEDVGKNDWPDFTRATKQEASPRKRRHVPDEAQRMVQRVKFREDFDSSSEDSDENDCISVDTLSVDSADVAIPGALPHASIEHSREPWGFFEKQTPGTVLCGQHALNNALGRHAVSFRDCEKGAKLVQLDTGEPLRLHMNRNPATPGDFSHGALARTLLEHTPYKLDSQPVRFVMRESGLKSAFDAIPTEGNVIGILLHEPNHWTAVRQFGAHLYYFDSCAALPERITPTTFAAKLRRHSASFRVIVR